MAVSMTLYGLADAREQIDRALDATEGELTPDLDTALTQWEWDFDKKAEAVALYVIEELATAKAIKGEEERLAARRQALERRAVSLKQYLEAQMVRVGKRKIEGVYATVAMQLNNPRVHELVPLEDADYRRLMDTAPEFVRHTPESFALNKDAILDAHKAGTLPSTLTPRIQVVRTESLRIR
jgi:hypothetical protein